MFGVTIVMNVIDAMKSALKVSENSIGVFVQANPNYTCEVTVTLDIANRSLLREPHLQMSASSKSQLTAQEIRNRFTRFRILVIGRANAGKTTILRTVCNTTTEPMIFDPNGKKVKYIVKVHGPILTMISDRVIGS
jgi:polynucleotide 5'-kinase involved in rRNA processing